MNYLSDAYFLGHVLKQARQTNQPSGSSMNYVSKATMTIEFDLRKSRPKFNTELIESL